MLVMFDELKAGQSGSTGSHDERGKYCEGSQWHPAQREEAGQRSGEFEFMTVCSDMFLLVIEARRPRSRRYFLSAMDFFYIVLFVMPEKVVVPFHSL
jgi:hypothetical protein